MIPGSLHLVLHLLPQRGRAPRHGVPWLEGPSASESRGSACRLRFDWTGRRGSAAVASEAQASQPSVLPVGVSGRLYQAVQSGKHFLSSVPMGHCSMWLPSSLTCPAMFLLRSVNAQRRAGCHPAQRMRMAPHTRATRHTHGPHSGTRNAGPRAHAEQRAPGRRRRRAHTVPSRKRAPLCCHQPRPPRAGCPVSDAASTPAGPPLPRAGPTPAVSVLVSALRVVSTFVFGYPPLRLYL